MPLTQFTALTGRRYRPNYTAMVNARLPYLPAMSSRREALQHQRRMQGLAQQRLDIEREASKEARKTARRAQTLGWAGLGVKTGLAALPYFADTDVGPGVSALEVPKSIIETIQPGIGPVDIGGAGTGAYSVGSKLGADLLDLPGLGPLFEGGKRIWDLGSEALGGVGSYFSGLFS